jgi:rRNA-processing protein FCF1
MCRRCGTQVRPQALEAQAFIIDSNVYDVLVETPKRQRSFIDAHERDLVEFHVTHIQIDEIDAIPDETLRNRIAAIPFVVTPTYGIVLDTSRLALARFGEPERIDDIRSESGGHTHDALLAATAGYEGAILVTGDHRLTNRARAEGIEVWTARQLVEFVEAL